MLGIHTVIKNKKQKQQPEIYKGRRLISQCTSVDIFSHFIYLIPQDETEERKKIRKVGEKRF